MPRRARNWNALPGQPLRITTSPSKMLSADRSANRIEVNAENRQRAVARQVLASSPLRPAGGLERRTRRLPQMLGAYRDLQLPPAHALADARVRAGGQ